MCHKTSVPNVMPNTKPSLVIVIDDKTVATTALPDIPGAARRSTDGVKGYLSIQAHTAIADPPMWAGIK